MRDYLDASFEFDDEVEEDAPDPKMDIKIPKSHAKIQPVDAYSCLERLGVWVTRNYWEFERPPIEGAQPGDSPYVLTFNNDWSDHYMWCLVNPVNNLVTFDSCFVNNLFDQQQ